MSQKSPKVKTDTRVRHFLQSNQMFRIAARTACGRWADHEGRRPLRATYDWGRVTCKHCRAVINRQCGVTSC